MADFGTWKGAVLGVGLDIDGSFGKQCVDVALSWGQALFPGIAWSSVYPPVGSAKDMYDHYNATYWDRVANDHNNPSQVPPQGAVAIFAGAPEAGYTSTYANPDGHVGVVDHTDANYIYLIQQQPGGATSLQARPWRYTRLIGWLIPKSTAAPTPTPPPASDGSAVGKVLYLHPVDKWRVYRVGDKPAGTNAIAFLTPKNYDSGLAAPKNKGLTYVILGVSKYPNTYTIRTGVAGLVDIYVDSDGEII